MLTAANELIIREALADQIELLNTSNLPVGFVQPSPTYANDVSEFWAVFDSGKDTKDEIDQTTVAGCWLYPLFFEDVPDAGCLDKPLIRVSYEFYLFRQYGLLREGDADLTPEIFDTKILVNHNNFIDAWLAIKASFQGRRTMDMAGIGLTGFTSAHTNSVVQSEDIQNQAICEFVPGIVGFSVKLRETVELQVA